MQPTPRKSGDSSIEKFREGLLHADRVLLAKAITFAESTLPEDRTFIEALIASILPHTGKSIRVGITGAPGVGKSSFIESFGKHLTSMGRRVAILSVDPSSPRTKGSILGDKTRMEELARDELAFIRPSPSGISTGGVASGTRESILLCEAAGYNIIIIETVGVGQSEVIVRSMVDFFLLLLLPGSGDELQGIKKGIMEMADGIAITKSDGDRIALASQAQADFAHALHLFQLPESGLTPNVISTSAIEKKGMKETWEMISLFSTHTTTSGFFQSQRQRQQVEWFRSCLDTMLKSHVLGKSKNAIDNAEREVFDGKILATHAARTVIGGMR